MGPEEEEVVTEESDDDYLDETKHTRPRKVSLPTLIISPNPHPTPIQGSRRRLAPHTSSSPSHSSLSTSPTLTQP